MKLSIRSSTTVAIDDTYVGVVKELSLLSFEMIVSTLLATTTYIRMKQDFADKSSNTIQITYALRDINNKMIEKWLKST